MIGNWASCKRLRDWLTQWKETIDLIEKASQRNGAKQHRRNDGSGRSDGILMLSVLDIDLLECSCV